MKATRQWQNAFSNSDVVICEIISLAKIKRPFTATCNGTIVIKSKTTEFQMLNVGPRSWKTFFQASKLSDLTLCRRWSWRKCLSTEVACINNQFYTIIGLWRWRIAQTTTTTKDDKRKQDISNCVTRQHFSSRMKRYMKTYALPRAELEVDVIDILWLLDYFGYFKRARNYQIQGSAGTKVFEIGKHRSWSAICH